MSFVLDPIFLAWRAYWYYVHSSLPAWYCGYPTWNNIAVLIVATAGAWSIFNPEQFRQLRVYLIFAPMLFGMVASVFLMQTVCIGFMPYLRGAPDTFGMALGQFTLHLLTFHVGLLATITLLVLQACVKLYRHGK